jgi:hypothetical protein
VRTTTPNRLGKKIVTAVAASVLVFGATACGSDDDTDDPVDEPADVDTPLESIPVDSALESIPMDSVLEPVTS